MRAAAERIIWVFKETMRCVTSEGPGGRVLGVDAGKAGWVGIALDDGRVTAAGRRWPSVFKTPVRTARQAPDHVRASTPL